MGDSLKNYDLVFELADNDWEKEMEQLKKDKAKKKLSLENLHELNKNCLLAIQYLNQKGAIHADIKPENIMLVGGESKLGDLGLATIVHENHFYSGKKGTPNYIPPETKEFQQMTQSNDLFALAISTIRILTYLNIADKNLFNFFNL